MIHRVYYQDTYCFELTTQITYTGTDDYGHYIVPEQTIFHPQGGGQPDDEGYFLINNVKYEVHKLVGDKEKGDIKHYYHIAEGAPPLKKGETIHMAIDAAKRKQFAAYHTAGHLVADLVEEAYPELFGIKGNHFPGKGAVVFLLRDKLGQDIEKSDYLAFDLEAMKTKITQGIKNLHAANAPITIDHSSPKRTMQIATMPKIPCGGTHLRSIGELTLCTITKIAFKKREGLKVSYFLEEE